MQSIAYSDGQDVRFASVAKLEAIPGRVCRGGWGTNVDRGTLITALAFDALSPGKLYAGSEAGDVLVRDVQSFHVPMMGEGNDCKGEFGSHVVYHVSGDCSLLSLAQAYRLVHWLSHTNPYGTGFPGTMCWWQVFIGIAPKCKENSTNGHLPRARGSRESDPKGLMGRDLCEIPPGS